MLTNYLILLSSRSKAQFPSLWVWAGLSAWFLMIEENGNEGFLLALFLGSINPGKPAAIFHENGCPVEMFLWSELRPPANSLRGSEVSCLQPWEPAILEVGTPVFRPALHKRSWVNITQPSHSTWPIKTGRKQWLLPYAANLGGHLLLGNR